MLPRTPRASQNRMGLSATTHSRNACVDQVIRSQLHLAEMSRREDPGAADAAGSAERVLFGSSAWLITATA